MKQNISSFDFYTKIAPSNSRLKSRVCDGKIIKGEYTVSGEIWDKEFSKLVPYKASGWFDARRDVGR